MARGWMPMYWGDYLADTRDLSVVEHGAYLLLLGTYYATGEPLPANAKQLLRVCSAVADEEKEAVLTVVDRFFYLDGDVYRNERADREIAKSLELAEKRSAAGQKGAQAKAKAKAPAKKKQMLKQLPTQSQSQSLSTNNTKRARRVPADWMPDDSHTEEAAKHGVDLDLELAKFRDHEFKDPRSDWSAAFRNWIRTAGGYAPKRKATKPAQTTKGKTYTGTPEEEVTWL